MFWRKLSRDVTAKHFHQDDRNRPSRQQSIFTSNRPGRKRRLWARGCKMAVDNHSRQKIDHSCGVAFAAKRFLRAHMRKEQHKMESALGRFAVVSQRAPCPRSYRILKQHDELRLRAFFLSFDFDQRQAYFGGAMSDPSIRQYCEAIDWQNTTIIARSSAICIDAIVVLNSLPTRKSAEWSLVDPPSGNQAQVVCELLNLAVDINALQCRKPTNFQKLSDRILLLCCGETGSLFSITKIAETVFPGFLQRSIPKVHRDGLPNRLVGLIAIFRKRRLGHPRVDPQGRPSGAGPRAKSGVAS